MRRNRRQGAEDTGGVATAAQVSALIEAGERARLGDVLVAQNLITPEQVSRALNLQAESGRQLGAILVEQGVIDPRVLTQALAAQLGLPTIDLRRERPTEEALALVPEPVARALRIVPLRVIGDVLDVAVVSATDAALREQLERLPVNAVNLYLAPQQDIAYALDTHYRVLSDVDDQVQQIWAQSTPQAASESRDAAIDAPIIRLVNKIVAQALRDRASDIHIEPTDGRLRIRYRIDGALREVLSLPIASAPELVSRIKIMADMDIVERRRPQDGQFHLQVDDTELDVRVATAATIWGETAVLRLLEKSRSLKQLGELGMPERTYERFLGVVHKPYGMLVCSGPTGSGKTTTLYATLAEISRSELNVMTIEDPVEYVVPSVNQMQINPQADVTFATGLKSILRQDPDVILVGEIRDTETARIAVQSALTGHLVMSSIHATDAASALYRLLDMGVEPFLVSSSLVGVVAQRLVRRVCEACAAPYQPTANEMRWYMYLGGPPKQQFVRGTGCNFCLDTGYRDRIGVYEVLTMSEEIGQLLVNGATPRAVRDLAIQQGMHTMGTEAMSLVARDVTTIDEVIRNVYLA